MLYLLNNQHKTHASLLPALQLADVHARLETESDVSGRVVEPHGILLAVPKRPSRSRVVLSVILLGYGLCEILVKALGAGREVDLRVDANNLPAMTLYFKLSGGTLFAERFRTWLLPLGSSSILEIENLSLRGCVIL